MKNFAAEHISLKRAIYLSLAVISSLLFTFLLGLKQELLVDEIYCIAIISIIFLAVFIIAILHKRINNNLEYNATSYSHFFIMELVCWALILIFSTNTTYIAPVMLISFMLEIVLEDSLSMAFSMYMIMNYCICAGLGMFVLYAYTLMIIIGVLMMSYRKKHLNEHVFSSYMLFIGLLNFIIPLIFYYFTYYEVSQANIICCGVNALICILFICLLSKPLINWHKKECTVNYDVINDDEYPLLQEIKRYSLAEYNHAIKVSNLCKICAEDALCNEDICKTAGLYYRLGKTLGEPEIDNAIKATTDRCFPIEVVKILSEYNGIISKPSTPESAIVHIVDQIITKLELLKSDQLQISWNQDMVIYQSLNEMSASGMYDESGLSMNQFLKVRERLVREELNI